MKNKHTHICRGTFVLLENFYEFRLKGTSWWKMSKSCTTHKKPSDVSTWLRTREKTSFASMNSNFSLRLSAQWIIINRKQFADEVSFSWILLQAVISQEHQTFYCWCIFFNINKPIPDWRLRCLSPGWEGIKTKPVKVRCCPATVIRSKRKARPTTSGVVSTSLAARRWKRSAWALQSETNQNSSLSMRQGFCF